MIEPGQMPHIVLNYAAIARKMVKSRKPSTGAEKDKSRIANISALAPVEEHLWTASDEESSIERLTRDGMGYARARNWDLEELFPAFAMACEKARRKGKGGNKKLEADLEGLAFDPETRRLWMVGSHCRGRGSTTNVAPQALSKPFAPKRQPLRTLLGFMPIEGNGAPAKGAGLALPFGEARGALRAAVKAEGGHLAEALNWPSKENGFDIEGIAVKDTEVLLGLRGPTAGGYAIVMRLSVSIGAKELSLRKEKGSSYGLSFLDLNGLGVRGLFRQGDDVLVLAGPTMDLDAPFALYRWHGAFARRATRDEKLEAGGELLEFLFDFGAPNRSLTCGRPEPHERPEGIAVVGRGLLVVYDRPARWRLQLRGTLKADLLNLPRSSKLRRPPE